MNCPRPLRTVCATILLAAAAFLPNASAQTETILHSFLEPQVLNDGASSQSSLVQGADGSFYGTTQSGGSTSTAGSVSGNGTIFKITTAGVVTILHSFADGSVANDGYQPRATLIKGLDGSFYGTTTYGGVSGEGTVFKLTAAGAYSILHNFGDATVTNEGATPIGALVQTSDGNFYGTTYAGGLYNEGTIFKMTTGGTETVLHSMGSGTDGFNMQSGLTLGTNGILYGTTYSGGTNGNGTVYKITTAGVETVLHNFNAGVDGYNSYSDLVLGTDGAFYGTISGGGPTNGGVLFKITTSGTFTLLHNFLDGSTVNDGYAPQGALTLGKDGNFYGVTTNGGANGTGAFFKMTPGGTVTTVYSLGTTANDGYYAWCRPVQGTDGKFYGTTLAGGAAISGGIVFQVSTSGAYTILHRFLGPKDPSDGQNPQSNLVQDGAGNIFGATVAGGAGTLGTIFELTSVGAYSVVHDFTTDGNQPYDAPIRATDGNYYGTTRVGSTGYGSLYKLTPQGILTTLHNFNDGSVANDGYSPSGSLFQASDGNIYGVTTSGGDPTTNGGAVYKITLGGTYSVIHRFQTATEGYSPIGGLVQYTDGKLYGTTTLSASGSTTGSGTIYKVTTSGTYTTVHVIDNGTKGEGSYPLGTLLLSGGNFYGVCQTGTGASAGSVFKVTPAGAFTVLHTFVDGTVTNDANQPTSGLVQLTDGNFGGVAQYGGAANYGAVYEVTPTGGITILHSFADGSVTRDGTTPLAALLEGTDGTLYGTTHTGGTGGVGTLYKVNKPDQTITFPTIPSQFVNAAPITLSATASSGLTPVIFTVVSGPATVSGSTVTLTGVPGTVVLQAKQVGAPLVAPGIKTQSFAVTLVPQSIAFGKLSDAHTIDPPITLTATASSGLPVSYTVTGPATVSGSTLALTGAAGPVAVTAHQAGNGTYAVAPTVTQSFSVALTPQTISFPAIATTTFPVAPFATGAFATSGLAVTYAVSGPATVSNNTVTVTGAGKVSIRALQTGDTRYAAATSVLQSFTVNKGTQTVTFPAIATQTAGSTLALAATSTSGGPLTYALTSGPATLSGGTLTFTGAGTVMVTASQAGTTNYLSATSAPASIKVVQATQAITFPAVGSKTTANSPITLAATSTSGLTITYTVVSGPATVSGSKLTLTGAGTVKVTASQAGNAIYKAATAKTQNIKVTVLKAQTITFPTIGDQPVGTVITLTAKASSKLAIVYTASGHVTISGTKATVTGKGKISIRASQPGNSIYAAATSVVQTFNGL